jgi:zinc and cadmium transporter
LDATFAWIVGGGVLMSAIALVGSVTLLLSERALQGILLPLVAFAAGSLLGGAFFHMLPVGTSSGMDELAVYGLVLAGFAVFFGLEQFLHWRHCHRAEVSSKKPLTYLILIGDALHNLLGGIAVAATFLIDIRLGVVTWLAAAAHEVPQELGDFAVLVHGGWNRFQALRYNVLSSLTFLIGGLIAYAASFRLDVSFLVPFAAGNFIYIGAADLIPEVKAHPEVKSSIIHFAAFAGGVLLMLLARIGLES